MKWPKYLDRFPFSVIAQFVGVSERAVKGWKSRKTIPKNRVEAVRALNKRVKVATPMRRRRILKSTDSHVLSSLLDMAGTPASIEQIRRWKRKGEIPLKFRVFMVDAYREQDAPKKSAPGPEFSRSITRKDTKRFILHEITWEINKKLTDELLVELISLVSSAKPSGLDKKQFRMVGVVELELVTSDILTYAAGRLQDVDETGDIDAFSEQWSDYKKAVKSLARKLSEYIGDGFFIERLSLLLTRAR